MLDTYVHKYWCVYVFFWHGLIVRNWSKLHLTHSLSLIPTQSYSFSCTHSFNTNSSFS